MKVSTKALWDYLDELEPYLDKRREANCQILGPDDVRQVGYERFRARGYKGSWIRSPLSCQRLLDMYMGEEVPLAF